MVFGTLAVHGFLAALALHQNALCSVHELCWMKYISGACMLPDSHAAQLQSGLLHRLLSLFTGAARTSEQSESLPVTFTHEPVLAAVMHRRRTCARSLTATEQQRTLVRSRSIILPERRSFFFSFFLSSGSFHKFASYISVSSDAALECGKH